MRGRGIKAGITTPDPLQPISWRAAYRLRWKRRALIWRCLRGRRDLTAVANRTGAIRRDDIIAVVVLRNEALRLPYMLDFYRKSGVGHFLVVDNGSDDGSLPLLDAPDISLWRTSAGYRASRFGLDWSGWLLWRYGHGHWCLTVDVDELLVYPGMERHPLPALVRRLERTGQRGFGAMLLDLYPKGPLGRQTATPGQDPTEILPWFDATSYRAQRQYPRGNLWLQGGPRDRVFFAAAPRRAPTLNKIPLIRWRRSYAYTNSTHAALPRWLNGLYAGPGLPPASGVLLHTKFLPEITEKARIEKARGQHFHDPPAFDDYYDAVAAGPDLWHDAAVRYRNPQQLADLGLCTPVDFS